MIASVASRSFVRTVVQRQPASQLISKRNMSGTGGIPLGKRQIEQFKNWIPSAVTFGATGGVALVYFTDWHVITDWIPFYNGKYKKD